MLYYLYIRDVAKSASLYTTWPPPHPGAAGKKSHGNRPPWLFFVMAKKSPRLATIEITPDEITLIRRHLAMSVGILERYAHEAENSQAVYQRLLAFEKRVKETLDEVLQELERINRLLILDETGRGGSGEAGEIRSEIKQELSSAVWQLHRRLKNLQYLENQAAGYGAANVPLYLINEITDEQEAIQALQLGLGKPID